MAEKSFPHVLVIGGTGTQGGNAARELLKHGHHVRVLARNPESPAAKRLEQLGAEIVQGDLGEQPTLVSAMKDITAIFSAQYTDPSDTSIELRNAYNMIQVAKKTGVQQIIHTSVIGTNIFPRWNKSPLLSNLWEIKYEVEEYIRKGGFQYWTILHPSFFMENFAEPLSKHMAPELKQGKLFGILHPETLIKLNCGEDTARLARGGFENPEKFHAKDINIASEELSMDQVAAQLSQQLGRTIVYEEVTVEEGVKRGLWEGTAQSHHWMNEVPGFGFDLNETLAYGIPLKSFKQWITENKSLL